MINKEDDKMQGKAQLLTKKDLAARWQLTEQTINQYVKEKRITPVKGLPCVRFNLQHIMKLEQTEIERYSLTEFRNIEQKLNKTKNELEEVAAERDYLINVLAEMDVSMSKFRYKMTQKKID
jgi:hypothetical protein